VWTSLYEKIFSRRQWRFYIFHDNLVVIRAKCRYRRRMRKNTTFKGIAGAAYLALLWKWECESGAPCSEIGPAVRVSSRCAGGIVIIVCEGGRFCVLQSLKWPLESFLDEKKEKREKEDFRRHASTFEEIGERWKKKVKKDIGREGSE